MAAGADKARFFLEGSVSELREWERRSLFSRDEISAITAKRSAFEHTLNARGAATPAEWARYISYEMNLDALRKKRVARRKMKATAQGHAAQQRIFFLLDRATKKFPGSFELWLQFIEYGRKQSANKKVSRIFTDLLRLHPTKDSAWLYAAKWSMEGQGDMEAARSYFQRGLRFCKSSRMLYVEYARLEMAHLARLLARRKILGLDPTVQRVEVEKPTQDYEDENMIALPSDLGIHPDLDGHQQTESDDSNVEKFTSAPAMTGAIPRAIFDAAMKTFNNDEKLGEKFFDMFFEFGTVPCTQKILNHVITTVSVGGEHSIVTSSCQCKLPLVNIAIDSPHYPAAVGLVLKSIKSSMSRLPGKEAMFARSLLSWLQSLADSEDLAPELKQVLASTIRRLSGMVEKSEIG